MAQSDGTTTGVELFSGNLKLSNAVNCLRSECLVDLKNVNVVDSEASLLKSGRDGNSWADSHDLRRASSNSVTNDAAFNLKSVLLGDISSCEEDCSSSISDLTRVSSGDATTYFLESGQAGGPQVFGARLPLCVGHEG